MHHKSIIYNKVMGIAKMTTVIIVKLWTVNLYITMGTGSFPGVKEAGA